MLVPRTITRISKERLTKYVPTARNASNPHPLADKSENKSDNFFLENFNFPDKLNIFVSGKILIFLVVMQEVLQ